MQLVPQCALYEDSTALHGFLIVDQEESKEISVIEEEDDQLWCVCCEEEKSCKLRWFHYNCVGLSRKPSGS